VTFNTQLLFRAGGGRKINPEELPPRQKRNRKLLRDTPKGGGWGIEGRVLGERENKPRREMAIGGDPWKRTREAGATG